jgi:2,4-dienoyl-CoA reductase (NADPH2)
MVGGSEPISCLVNPRACYETQIEITPAETKKRVAVVGAGAAGLSFAITAAQRGHSIVVFEAMPEIGGLLNLARQVPGKSEFGETIRYYRAMVRRLGIDVRLNSRPSVAELRGESFDEIVVATGVRPRLPQIPGIDGNHVISYADLLSGRRNAKNRVVIIGAGPIGLDVAMFLLCDRDSSVNRFCDEWGIDMSFRQSGGLRARSLAETSASPQKHEVTLLQRSEKDPFLRLGKSVGWVCRAELRRRRAQFMKGVHYERILPTGVEISKPHGGLQLIPADTVIICAGQEPADGIRSELGDDALPIHVIGGAASSAEIDAFRAINDGFKLGACI